MLTLAEVRRNLQISGGSDDELTRMINNAVERISRRTGIHYPADYGYHNLGRESKVWRIDDPMALLDGIRNSVNRNVFDLDPLSVIFINDANVRQVKIVDDYPWEEIRNNRGQHRGFRIIPPDGWADTLGIPTRSEWTIRLRWATGFTDATVPARWKELAHHMVYESYFYRGGAGPNRDKIEDLLRHLTVPAVSAPDGTSALSTGQTYVSTVHSG